MIIRQVYNHEYASIVETDSSYLFFGGRNIGAFKVGEELTAPLRTVQNPDEMEHQQSG